VTEGGATELSFDFGGDALQEVVAVNGLLTPLAASRWSEPKCSVREDVTEGVAINDRADILGRCASTTTLCRLRASTFGLVSVVVLVLRVDFGGTAL